MAGALTESDEAARFDELQRRLVPLWQSIQTLTEDEQTIVVVPSLTLEDPGWPSSVLQAYEERFLFLLLLLRQPRARLVYVTSQPINPSIIDYYLDLLPGVIPSHARRRLFLVSPHDGSGQPLSEKLLERPRLLAQIRDLVRDRNRAHLVPFNTTELERDLALALGIPMYGADPRLFHYGTKTGCRRLFADARRTAPARRGRPGENRRRGRRLAAGCVPSGRRWRKAIVKLNEGVSGEGNASVDLGGLPAPGADGEASRARGARARDGLRIATSPLRLVRRGSRGARRNRRGAHRRRGGAQPERPAAGHAARRRSRCCPRTTSCSAARAASPTSAAASRPIRRTPRRSRARRRRSASGSREEGVIGRFAVDFVAVRRATDWDAVRDRAQPAQGRYDASVPHAPVPDGRRYDPETARLHRAERPREALRRDRPRREPPRTAG